RPHRRRDLVSLPSALARASVNSLSSLYLASTGRLAMTRIVESALFSIAQDLIRPAQPYELLVITGFAIVGMVARSEQPVHPRNGLCICIAAQLHHFIAVQTAHKFQSRPERAVGLRHAPSHLGLN